MKSVAFALAAVLALAALPAQAAEQIVDPSSETKFDKNPSIDGKGYLCLGAGIRKKFIVKVYAIAFCVDEAAGKDAIAKYFEGPGKKHAALKGNDLADALSEDKEFLRFLVEMPVDKSAEIVFVRDVSGEKMRGSFGDGLKNAMGEGEKDRIANFVKLLDQDIKEGDHIAIRTRADGGIFVKHKEPKEMNDAKLAAGIWTAYFGVKSPPSPALLEAVAKGTAALRP